MTVDRWGGEDVSKLDCDDVFERIPDVSGEAFVFKGTQVPVMDWFESLIAKGSLSAIADDYPAIGQEQAKAALMLASSRLVERHHAK